jgi:superfamily I DNA and/or RNA helicase
MSFTGEEADIVLLSLVRNPGAGKSGAIGFLKVRILATIIYPSNNTVQSPNRANVALTRARHGMYVFGHGDLLAQKSPMWTKVVEEFQDQDAYGETLPISCHRHPTDVRYITEPAQIRQVSPDGKFSLGGLDRLS